MKRLVFGLLAIFVLGNVSGAFIGARFQDERRERRDRIDLLEINIMKLFEDRLTLDQSQVEAIEPLVSQACLEMREVYKSGADSIEKIIRKYHHLIAEKLTPEQDKILKEMEAERRRRNEEREPDEDVRL